MEQSFNCRQANTIDLVDFLAKLGYRPSRIVGNDYWYLSPLRTERTASFKVNRQKNVWFDHGIGKGGSLVDFGRLYFDCTIKELLARLKSKQQLIVPFQQPKPHIKPGDETGNSSPGKIRIISHAEISDRWLVKYLLSRAIPLSVAQQFCHEVRFELKQKLHLAIGFQNPGGGYELRSANFKGSSTPKQPRLIVTNSDANFLTVFEGFFDFLSHQTLLMQEKRIIQLMPDSQSDYLVLNSLSFFENSRGVMDKYKTVNLFLDRDQTGLRCAQKALQWSDKYRDQSILYEKHKDLSEYLEVIKNLENKQSRHKGLRL